MAIDWMSPAVLLKTQSTLSISTWFVKPLLKGRGAVIFNNFSHWAIGCYCLEWLLSLKFEWSVLTRRRPFRWPMLVCTARLGVAMRALTPAPVALLLHEVVTFESVLFRLNVWPLRLIGNPVAFVGMLVAFNIASPINCQALYSSNQYFGNTGFVILRPFPREFLTRPTELPPHRHFSC